MKNKEDDEEGSSLRLSECFEEMDILGDTIEESVSIQITRGQANKERTVHGKSPIALRLDPETPSDSFLVYCSHLRDISPLNPKTATLRLNNGRRISPLVIGEEKI